MYGYLGCTLLAAFSLWLLLWLRRTAMSRCIAATWIYCALGATLWLLNPGEVGALGAAAAIAFTELAALQVIVAILYLVVLKRFKDSGIATSILIGGGSLAILVSLLVQ